MRENVKFGGGNMSRWVNDRYGSNGCAIAIEMKKIFMDEWTDDLDESITLDVGAVLGSAAQAVRNTLSESATT